MEPRLQAKHSSQVSYGSILSDGCGIFRLDDLEQDIDIDEGDDGQQEEEEDYQDGLESDPVQPAFRTKLDSLIAHKSAGKEQAILTPSDSTSPLFEREEERKSEGDKEEREDIDSKQEPETRGHRRLPSDATILDDEFDEEEAADSCDRDWQVAKQVVQQHEGMGRLLSERTLSCVSTVSCKTYVSEEDSPTEAHRFAQSPSPATISPSFQQSIANEQTEQLEQEQQQQPSINASEDIRNHHDIQQTALTVLTASQPEEIRNQECVQLIIAPESAKNEQREDTERNRVEEEVIESSKSAESNSEFNSTLQAAEGDQAESGSSAIEPNKSNHVEQQQRRELQDECSKAKPASGCCLLM